MYVYVENQHHTEGVKFPQKISIEDNRYTFFAMVTPKVVRFLRFREAFCRLVLLRVGRRHVFIFTCGWPRFPQAR